MDRSAAALLEIAETNGTLTADLEQAIKIRDAFDRPDVQAFLKDSRVPAQAKNQLVRKVFGDQLPWYWQSFLYQMIRDNLASQIVSVLTDCIGQLNRRLGRIEAQVVSAVPLTEQQISRIRAALAKQINMQVEIYAKVDPALIGGFYVMIDGKIFDGTVRAELERMKASLKQGIDIDRKPDEISRLLQELTSAYPHAADFYEAGTVTQVGDGIARVQGLYSAMSGELLQFANGVYGMALNLDEDSIGAVILGSDAGIKEGDQVKLTGKMVEVPVGDGLLGRIVNPLGAPLDDKGPIVPDAYRKIESPAPSVIMRQEVNRPLQTGIKAVDALVPIGRGQRELIIGDRQTGKTAIAIDTIINQKDQGVLCVYVAIGQKASTVARIVKVLKETGAMEYTTVVVSTASDSATLQYLAPYAGCAIAEEWMYRGKDVLIVYDDLSKHAVAYRAISLLLRRPPGREAYPGDVFYLHSRLLERAACLSKEYGGGTLTALPIIETQEGDISAYIPTNVISITDGQIYLEADLFNHGFRPAINPGFSVSRVGGSAQIPAMKMLAGPLRIEFAQYRELAVFSQFGSDLSQDTLDRLNHGERIMEVLKQPQYKPLPVEDQVLILYALNKGQLKNIEVARVSKFQKDFIKYVDTHAPQIKEEIKTTGRLSEQLTRSIDQIIAAVKAEYNYG